MKTLIRDLKLALSKLESVAERFESAGFSAQAEEIDEAVERVEGILTDITTI
jgi:hypothetical protein